MMLCKKSEGHFPFPVFMQHVQEHLYQADGKEGGRHGSGQAGVCAAPSYTSLSWEGLG